MSENTSLVDANTGDIGIAVTAQDIKYWEQVQAVMEKYHEGYGTTQEACEAAGVTRSLYYRALRNPYVQGMTVQRMEAMNAATLTVIEREWVEVVRNMLMLATSAANKESVQAARFIRDVYTDMEKRRPDMANTGDDSQAAMALRSFLGGKRVKVKQTTVTQEISVGSEDKDDKEDTIEGKLAG